MGWVGWGGGGKKVRMKTYFLVTSNLNEKIESTLEKPLLRIRRNGVLDYRTTIITEQKRQLKNQIH